MRDFSGDAATSKKYDFNIDDIDFDTDPLMPRISFSDNIEVFGDYFANINDKKNVKSTFRMYIDYENIIKSAYGSTKLYFKKYKNKEEFPCPDTSTNDVGFDYNTFFEEDRVVQLELFNAQFTTFDSEYL